jgi:hypothetical protein
MNYLPITGIIFLFGYLFVRKLSNLIYHSDRYTKALDQKFNYDDLVEENKTEIEK